MSRIYRSVQGDTFDMIAWKLWKNEHLCHELMAANPEHMDVLLFPAGVELAVPDVEIEPKKAELPPWYEE